MRLLTNRETKKVISVGARSSALSQKQVEEVLNELQKHSPEVGFEVHLLETQGDLDQKTSLRDLGKTDFFTREIDQMQLKKDFELSIHSAKDLPEKLAEGLIIAAITKGVDPRDSLVLPEGESLESLPPGALIAVSSERREQSVNKLRSDFQFCDIRGTIEKRLEQLEFGRVDGVVIAEAALIRLGKTELNRIILEEFTVEGQGQLALVVRKEHRELLELFRPLDSR